MQKSIPPLYKSFGFFFVGVDYVYHYHKALTTLRQYQPKGLGGLVRI
ncbi:hypothetical protein P2E20_10415 [Mannheimia haemolytica]|nr:hypothetical protein [Mannheimia haemolytica]